MKLLKIFTQPNCPNCPPAKELGQKLVKEGADQVRVEYWDTSTVDGMAEASFYAVMATPSLVLCDEQGKEIKSWRGQAPGLTEVKSLLK